MLQRKQTKQVAQSEHVGHRPLGGTMEYEGPVRPMSLGNQASRNHELTRRESKDQQES